VPHWPSVMHCTQAGEAALPLQRVPPFSLHVVLAGSDGFDGAPFVQMSIVQPLPSTRTSLLSLRLTWLPDMQTFFLQSPAVWLVTGVPSAVLLIPHIPDELQVRWWHSVSVPLQSVVCRHCTQAGLVPLPLHLLPPPRLQAVPPASGGFDGMPAAHRSCVQALPSTGLSLSSLTVWDWPWPSHWTFLQSPA